MNAPAPELPSRYAPTEVEGKWYARWEAAGAFKPAVAAPPATGGRYVIVIPPPNVTGALHMGHALNNALQDILVRFERMRGREALWLPGTDHAGIATQHVVDRQLRAEGLSREKLGREKFVERVWKWKEEYGDRIVHQLKKLGSSCDWSRTRFTMDEGLSRAVREAFVRYHERGLIYRGRYLINWCPQCRTALSDDESRPHDEEEASHLWYIRYPLQGSPKKFVTVATTRPETMLGDTAVAVHPNDERHRDVAGKTVILPLVNRAIPVLADPIAAQLEFGTGAVKITPAHDPNDFQTGLRHNLAQICVIGEDGRMNEQAGQYAGLDRFEARQRIVADLEALGLLEKIEPHKHKPPRCYRCDSIIEPYLSPQWFVRMKPMAEKAARATAEGRVRFHPERWTKVYLQWLENVRDWCISRQIWWGHRLPVWYCSACAKQAAGPDWERLSPRARIEKAEPLVAREPPAKCPKCGSRELEQDPDVLDTWFSSALWPFSTLGWPEATDDLKRFFPTSTLVTDRGIIYFWVARMAMAALELAGDVPFGDVYIHGTILDEQGRKMSKSAGNGIDPLIMIAGGVQQYLGKEYQCDGYGADAIRFSLILLTSEGQDVRLAPTKFELGRNFANKLWNAARFALMNLGEGELAAELPRERLALEDRWLLSRLARAVERTTAALEAFRFNEAGRAVYEFAWNELCDWYLELAKPRLRAGGADAALVRRLLAEALGGLLRLLSPFMPFLAEELWSHLRRLAPRSLLLPERAGVPQDFLMLAAWPPAQPALLDEAAERDFAMLEAAVVAARRIREKLALKPKERPPLVVATETADLAAALAPLGEKIALLAGTAPPEIGLGLPKPAGASAEAAPGMQVYAVASADRSEERRRAERELSRLADSLARLREKLANPNFVARAPAEVVAGERKRLVELEARQASLSAQLAEL